MASSPQAGRAGDHAPRHGCRRSAKAAGEARGGRGRRIRRPGNAWPAGRACPGARPVEHLAARAVSPPHRGHPPVGSDSAGGPRARALILGARLSSEARARALRPGGLAAWTAAVLARCRPRVSGAWMHHAWLCLRLGCATYEAPQTRPCTRGLWTAHGHGWTQRSAGPPPVDPAATRTGQGALLAQQRQPGAWLRARPARGALPVWAVTARI